MVARATIYVAALLLPHLVGCSAKQAASVQVTVLSVTPLNDDVIKDLTTDFGITPAIALSEALPDTAAFRGAELRGFFLGLKLALPQLGLFDTTATKTHTIEDGEDKGKTVTTSQTPGDRSGKTGDLPTAESKPFGDATAKALMDSLFDGKLKADGKPGLLKYGDAASLYEFVKLMKYRLTNAAFDANKPKKFVVQLQISVMPHSRDYDADTYVNLSFIDFPDCAANVGGTVTIGDNPQVIPLLATDSMEAAQQSRADQEIIRTAFAAAGGFGGATGQLDQQSLQDTIQAGIGRTYNSLLTMGRLSGNSVRVRLGAFQQVRADKKYANSDNRAILPRTQNIALLMAAKEPTKRVAAIADTSFADWRGRKRPGGEALYPDYLTDRTFDSIRSAILEDAQEHIESAMEESIPMKDGLASNLRRFITAVQFNNEAGAAAVLCRMYPPVAETTGDGKTPPVTRCRVQELLRDRPESAAVLWSRITALRARTAVSLDTFDLPVEPPAAPAPELFDSRSRSLPLRETDDALIVRVPVKGKAVKAVDLDTVSAELRHRVGKDGKEETLSSGVVTFDAATRSLAVRFDMFSSQVPTDGTLELVVHVTKKVAAATKPPTPETPAAKAPPKEEGAPKAEEQTITASVTYGLELKRTVFAAISPATDSVTARDDVAEFLVTVQLAGVQAAKLHVAGAQFDSVEAQDPAPAASADGTAFNVAAGIYKVKVKNATGAALVLTLQAAGAPLQFKTITLVKAEKPKAADKKD